MGHYQLILASMIFGLDSEGISGSYGDILVFLCQPMADDLMNSECPHSYTPDCGRRTSTTSPQAIYGLFIPHSRSWAGREEQPSTARVERYTCSLQACLFAFQGMGAD